MATLAKNSSEAPQIFAQQARDARLLRSRFDVCSLLGHLTLSTNSSVLFDLFPLPLYLFLPLFWGFWWILSSRKPDRRENPSSNAESPLLFLPILIHGLQKHTSLVILLLHWNTWGISERVILCVGLSKITLLSVVYLALCIINITHILMYIWHYIYIYIYTVYI